MPQIRIIPSGESFREPPLAVRVAAHAEKEVQRRGEKKHRTLPGPPAEKDPPPPIRNCRTVTAVLPFTSFQPPGYSNASKACVKSAGLYCLRQQRRLVKTMALFLAPDAPLQVMVVRIPKEREKSYSSWSEEVRLA